MAQFSKTVQNFAFQYDLWKKNSKIVLGVSGGPDSMCMLDFFSKLSDKYNLKLHVAHVNYGLRGADSKKDEALVIKACEKRKIPYSVLRLKPPFGKGNLEENLRNLRYDFFEKLRMNLAFDLIAIAHNEDDQAETVLMRIVRGSGLNGLAAMRPRAGFIIRPFLQTSRVQIMAYLKENKVPYGLDITNKDKKFTRNKIRHELLPYLEKEYNPQIKNALCSLSLSVASDYEFISIQAERFDFETCTNKCVCFNAKKFLKKHKAVQNQIIRNSVALLLGGLCGWEASHADEILKIIKSSKNKSQKATIKGLNIWKKGDKVEIFPVS